MIRPASTPWIHRWSRLLIAAIAGCGALLTGYLLIEKLTGGSVACSAKVVGGNCNDVLSSPWATVFGQPLALFGFLAYTSMVIFALIPLAGKKELNPNNQNLQNRTWWLLLLLSIAMSIFSSYLMYLLASEIKILCLYCIASTLFSFSLLVITIIGRQWQDFGQIFFTAIIVGTITLIGALGIYASGGQPAEASDKIQISFVPTTAPNPISGWEITTNSTAAEIELARHLADIGAKEYIAYWCPHCQEQKLLFGQQAYQIISENVKIECAADSPLAKPDLCKTAKIEGYPTWIIKGKTYSGVQNLQELAKASGYTGSQEFKYYRR